MATDDRRTINELLREKRAFEEWLINQERGETTDAAIMLIDHLATGATAHRTDVAIALYQLLPGAKLPSQERDRIREIARNLLGSSSAVERSYALDLLRSCPPDPDDIDAVINLLADQDSLVQVSALDYLGSAAYGNRDRSIYGLHLDQFRNHPDPIAVGTAEAYRVLIRHEPVETQALLELGEEAVGAFARVVWEVWDPEDGPSVDEMHAQVSELATGLWKTSPDAIGITPLMDELDALRAGQSQEPGGGGQ